MEKCQWWQDQVVYQVYPISFMDADNDGRGDLKGLTAKVDYLAWLGVGIVWICPVYDSPLDDNGYDVRDYHRILPAFGTLDDWKALRDALHSRGMKLVMDLVVNHTSDEHPWFMASSSSAHNRYRDYYHWRPSSPEGGPPNDWVSYFSGSAWERSGPTGEWFLHLRGRRQPELNWANPRVRDEVRAVVDFWLDLGVDGFRLDAVSHLDKDPDFPPALPGPVPSPRNSEPHYLNRPAVHTYLRDLRAEVWDRKPDLITIGEAPGITPEDALVYAPLDGSELTMTYQFEHMELDYGPGGRWDTVPWKVTDLKRVLSRWQTELHGRAWNANYLGNHDQPRPVSRFGAEGLWRERSAKALATALHGLEGTPFVYQGEELGMPNAGFTSLGQYRDVDTLTMHHERLAARVPETEVWRSILTKSRDQARTPMPWNDAPNAGFNAGHEPWIGLGPSWPEVNVAAALANPDSVLHYYRRLISLRKTERALVAGRYELLDPGHPQLWVYTRTWEADDGSGEALLVVCNLSSSAAAFDVPARWRGRACPLVIANLTDPTALAHLNEELISDRILEPWEAWIRRRTWEPGGL